MSGLKQFRANTRAVLAVILVPTLLGTSACAGPGYYWQAASGHLELMRARQPVSEILANPSTDPELAQTLQTTRRMLRFAETTLALQVGDSYRSYVETGRSAVVWNVVATPEFSLEARRWCFPVAGCVPYRGYFEDDKARRYAERLRSRGLDVSVRGASAYSTLGWFSDPLLDTMLNTGDLNLAATLFHELAHQRVYVRGHTAFNEAYAEFVGREGVRAWLREQGQENRIPHWQALLDARAEFRRLQAETRSRLRQLYEEDITTEEMRARKQWTLRDMQSRYGVLVAGTWNGQDWFGGWFEPGINNADLALFGQYNDGVCAFRALFANAGGDFPAFHAMVEVRSGWTWKKRSEWLSTPCPAPVRDIASRPDM